jgi:hypothetical protein
MAESGAKRLSSDQYQINKIKLQVEVRCSRREDFLHEKTQIPPSA